MLRQAALFAFLMIECGQPKTPADAIDLVKARTYFAEMKDLCEKDHGRLWGKSLCGPVLFIDPESREVVANESDSKHLLGEQDGVFVGAWPKEESIANTATEWQGKRWTMMMWSGVPDDPSARRSLMMHESFHRLQPALALAPANTEQNRRHLDTRDGRVLLQLEWNALQIALLSTTERRRAIADALAFRAERRSKYPTAKESETSLEIMEGLAQYTGEKLAQRSNADVVKSTVERRARTKSFVRSFAYMSGPLYGYLLDETGAAWRTGLTVDSDLGAILAEKANATPSTSPEADRYDGVALRATEDERERAQNERNAEWRKTLVDGPVLVVDGVGGSFNPNKIFPLSDTEAVCVECRVLGPWGALSADEAPLLKVNGQSRVSLAGASPDFKKGKGWTLDLTNGFGIVPGDRPGDAKVVKR